MEDPLLGRSSSRTIVTKKWDHPFLSLISPNPRRKSHPWATESSPIDSPYPQPEEQPGRRPGHSNYDISVAHSCLRRDSPGGPKIENEVYAATGLHSIAEESWARSPSCSSGGLLGENVQFEDLESQPEYRNSVDENDENNRGVFGEPLIVDAEESKEEGGRIWKTSGVTRLLLAAFPSIPEVLNPFSFSPEDEFIDYQTGEHAAAASHVETNVISGTLTAGIHYPSAPSLTSVQTLSSSLPSSPPDTSLRGQLAAGLANGLLKDDREAHNLPSVDPLKQKEKIRRNRSLHKCRTAPMLTGCGKPHPKVEESVKSKKAKPKKSASSVVWQAVMGLCIYLCVGVMIYTWKREEFSGVKTVGVVDALYFCIVTMCTIGYGDITPITPSAKILACALVFVGFGFIDALLSGMLTFVLDRQEHLLLHVMEDGHHERARNYIMNSKKGRMRIRIKVLLAVSTVLMSMTVGALFLHHVEDLKWIDALYVTCISITTVGFGDYSFQTLWGRLFAAVWLPLGTLGVARAFLFLAEARVHKRHRKLAKNILEKKMTTDDMMTMDLDNDGHISKSEFVVYKLKEMGKIDQGDVEEICKQFDIIDSMNAGKITLAQLLE